MTQGHSIWFTVVWLCVIWYSTITVYVSIKGVLDIRQMLARLKRNHEAADPERTISSESPH